MADHRPECPCSEGVEIYLCTCEWGGEEGDYEDEDLRECAACDTALPLTDMIEVDGEYFCSEDCREVYEDEAT